MKILKLILKIIFPIWIGPVFIVWLLRELWNQVDDIVEDFFE